MNFEEKIDLITSALEEKKGEDIEVFDLQNQQTITDFMIICTGSSKIHIKALKDNVRVALTKAEEKIKAETGLLDSNWVILDYFDCIIHVMGPEERQYYHLEDLWENARVVYH
ncbi:ribosome silencing factor [Candidatus Margulisiibacteriota bacterium]